MNSIDEGINWLYSFEPFGMKLGLERIIYLSNKLGNPEKSIKIIHVGGTNGKGSVCRYIASILTEGGYKVGVYLSPHLNHISERFSIGNDRISDDDFLNILKKLKPIVESLIKENNPPTFFEICTALAFEYFKEKNVDFAVIEVGLGGRFDATNIVSPIVSVITNVTDDHQNVLGEKIEDISFEKAGILKKNVSLVTAAKGNALDVILGIADKLDVKVNIIDSSGWKRINYTKNSQIFSFSGIFKNYKLQTSMLGEFQGENIALSITAIENLQLAGYYIPESSIEKGILNMVHPGRMEIIQKRPIILLDGAHNNAAIMELARSLENDFDYNKLILVIGILSDKNIRTMLSKIIPFADIVISTKSNNPRASDPLSLKNMISEIYCSKNVIVKESIAKSCEYAVNLACENDMICITGSLFTVGEAKDYFKKIGKINQK